jgi:hypothetical protein
LRPKRHNSRQNDRDRLLNMMQLLRFKLRPTDLLLWLLMKLIELLKLQEELKRKNILLLIRDKCLLEETHSRKPLEMCGPLETPVFLSFI